MTAAPIRTQSLESVTGVQLAQGVGVQPAAGFWADAWRNVLKRRGAVMALCWLSVIAFFAVFAPLLANGHPLRMTHFDRRTAADAQRLFEAQFAAVESVSARDVMSFLRRELLEHSPRLRASEFFVPARGQAEVKAEEIARISAALGQDRRLDGTGAIARRSSPLFEHLSAADLLLVSGAMMGGPWIAFAGKGRRAARLGAVLYGAALAALTVVLCNGVRVLLDQAGLPHWLAQWAQVPGISWKVGAAVGLVVTGAGAAVPLLRGRVGMAMVVMIACAGASTAASLTWKPPLASFDYADREVAGEVQAVYTLVPWSPSQRFTALDRRPPPTRLGDAMDLPAAHPAAGHTFLLGTDAYGQDVLAQLVHASRLSISIGLVSTGIAVLIGVTLGAIMGYFGGVVDLVLFRVVEVFMAVPLLFLLIVAAGVLPTELRTTYTMMAIIGCFTWTGAARFTRAEFMKLRNQDFVQAAKAVGVPVRSVLFKHMLPNGVTPVLVDASFAIAAAISIEATLSFLGLGPVDQASWGKLLASAISAEGVFKWWLAVFPGAAIFLTVLSYNMLGESLRDAIDPKLKKARV